MTPRRIISLVPSLTELIFHLGLGHRLVGRTRFCVHPRLEVDRVAAIGGTKNPRLEKIRSLNPDIVIANREENRKEDVDAISEYTRVLVTDISTVDEALREMQRIGTALGRKPQTTALVDDIRKVIPTEDGRKPVRTLYLIWRDPWMAAGGDTYIHDVMKTFGLQNVCADKKRYPQLTGEAIRDLAPELILLSSEPYPFGEKHVREMTGVAGKSTIALADGEWFSWYGPRMLPSFRSLANWRHNF
ncbi:MAG: helical backbone metal receptor [Cyclonatronaceae bacterium]